MTRPAAILVAVTVFFAGTASAQTLSDKGKKKITKLFAEAVSAANQSTVSVRADDKEVAFGTVVAANGYVLTKGSELFNKDGLPLGTLSCVLRDGSAYDAEFVGYHKLTDLGLLKLDATGLKSVSFADAKLAEVGNWVAVPGLTDEPVAVGVVSVASRRLYGEQAFIENANKGTLGIGIGDPLTGEGVLVTEVRPDGGAAKAGMKRNDVIYEIQGTEIKDRKTLTEYMEKFRANDKVTVRVRRGEEEVALRVTLGKRGDVDRGAFQNEMGGSLSGRRTGFPKVIQHDTVIRPAQCGGPLVDLDGRVLGLNIARAGRPETWTLPGDVVMPIFAELKDGKHPAPKAK